MKLVAVLDGVCAICRVSPHEHERCGTCEGSIQLLRLCAFCDAWNKAEGVAWNRKQFDNGDDGEDDLEELTSTTSSQRRAPRAMRDEMTPTRRRGRPRSARIDDEVLPRLLRRKTRVKVQRFDRYGRSRGTYEIWAWSSRRQIARESGCSHASVDRRYHDYTRAKSRNSRATSARALTELLKQ